MAGLGFATFIARLFTPSGIHRLRLAVFDQVPDPGSEGGGDGLEQLVREAVDPSYSPFIRFKSSPRQQGTYVFLRQDGNRFDLLLVNAARRQAVVVGMRLDPEALQKWVDEPERMARSGARASQPAAPLTRSGRRVPLARRLDARENAEAQEDDGTHRDPRARQVQQDGGVDQAADEDGETDGVKSE
jgi:hypothetical protein